MEHGERPHFAWDAARWSEQGHTCVQNALERHCAMISHALGNPLTGLMLALELLASATTCSPEQARCVQRAEHAAARLAELVASVGYLGGGQAGQHAQAHSVADLVHQAVALSGLDSSYDLICSLDVGCTVWANAQIVRDALGQLLRNAVEANPHGGSLGVLATSFPHGVRLSVWDRGPGIKADVVTKLFVEPFPAVGSRKGLGLLLVAIAIQRCHGGRVGYTPCLGGGTAIHLELPIKGPT